MRKHVRMYERMSKLGQMEAFGLAVIVIMISVGLLLFISLRRTIPKENTIQIYVPQQLASNMVESMASTNVAECIDSDTTIARLLDYCSRGINMTKRCNGWEACELVNYTMHLILNKTLEVQGKPYRLFTEGLGWPDDGEIDLVYRNCTDKKPRVNGGTIIVQDITYKTMFLNLYICKQ
jgi:hypothetical protein